jgi:transcriptional regulator with XRE-family HTH domain
MGSPHAASCVVVPPVVTAIAHVAIDCTPATRRERMADDTGSSLSEERTAFDADAFFETVDGERLSRGLNWKQVASEAKVSQSTLTRVGQDRRPDVDSFARLIAWGGLDADQFVISPKMQQAGGFLTNLPTYLRSDPNLDDKGVHALETIIRAAYDQFRQSS